ncbi:hypothetical protein [Mucilaginibacter paludis]|uniref:hypothetical protein n=1 Tax=Mucilaginibacter paludis TaxID=423351 RepID=UPI0002DA8F3C|nr:hypothetical protein [Mucilaginibacter paludis]
MDDQGKAFLRKNNLKTDSFFVRTKINLNELNILMKEIDKAKLDSQYIQDNIQDAPSFKVMIYPERALPSQYKVYGDNYPRQLKKLEDYCRMLSEKQGWLYLKDTIIDFESREKQFQSHVKGIHFPPPEEKQ